MSPIYRLGRAEPLGLPCAPSRVRRMRVQSHRRAKFIAPSRPPDDYPLLHDPQRPVTLDLIRQHYDEISNTDRLASRPAEAKHPQRFCSHTHRPPPTKPCELGRSQTIFLSGTFRRNTQSRSARRLNVVRTGTAPTSSSSTAEAARLPAIAWTTKNSPCSPCIFSRRV